MREITPVKSKIKLKLPPSHLVQVKEKLFVVRDTPLFVPHPVRQEEVNALIDSHFTPLRITKAIDAEGVFVYDLTKMNVEQLRRMKKLIEHGMRTAQHPEGTQKTGGLF
ncbi:MAG: hypothetical protein V1834_00225 [Candidatus Micrarchaeota archaeon]